MDKEWVVGYYEDHSDLAFIAELGGDVCIVDELDPVMAQEIVRVHNAALVAALSAQTEKIIAAHNAALALAIRDRDRPGSGNVQLVTPKVGDRVLFMTIFRDGILRGYVSKLGFPNAAVVTVQLDDQKKPVSSVPCYDREPYIVDHYLQCCWPDPDA